MMVSLTSLRRRNPLPSAALVDTTVTTTVTPVSQVDILAAVSASQDATDDALTTQVILGLLENAKRLGLVWELANGRVVRTDPNTRVPYVRLDYDDIELRTPSLIGDVADGIRVTVLRTPPSSRYIIGTPLMYPRLVDSLSMRSGNVAASTSSWVTITNMNLTGYFYAGAAYCLTGQTVYYVSSTSTEGNLEYLDPSSTRIGRVRLGRLNFTGTGVSQAWSLPWVSTVTGEATLTARVQNASGVGTCTVQAGDHNWSSVYMMGFSGAVRLT